MSPKTPTSARGWAGHAWVLRQEETKKNYICITFGARTAFLWWRDGQNPVMMIDQWHDRQAARRAAIAKFQRKALQGYTAKPESNEVPIVVTTTMVKERSPETFRIAVERAVRTHVQNHEPKPWTTEQLDALPPTQQLILEILAARLRLGEGLWPFPTKHIRAIKALEKAGLVRIIHGNVEKSVRVMLTPVGVKSMQQSDYRSPLEKEHDAIQEKVAEYIQTTNYLDEELTGYRKAIADLRDENRKTATDHAQEIIQNSSLVTDLDHLADAVKEFLDEWDPNGPPFQGNGQTYQTGYAKGVWDTKVEPLRKRIEGVRANQIARITQRAGMGTPKSELLRSNAFQDFTWTFPDVPVSDEVRDLLVGPVTGAALLDKRRLGLHQADRFNGLVAIGSQVVYRPVLGEAKVIRTTTRSTAWVLGGGEPVVMVEGIAGGVSILHIFQDKDQSEHVTPWALARLPFDASGSMKQPMKRHAILVDTSGSMTGREDEAMKRVRELLTKYPHAEVLGFAYDSQGGLRPIDAKRHFFGAGGTPAPEQLAKEVKDYGIDVVIDIITDDADGGWGPGKLTNSFPGVPVTVVKPRP